MKSVLFVGFIRCMSCIILVVRLFLSGLWFRVVVRLLASVIY